MLKQPNQRTEIDTGFKNYKIANTNLLTILIKFYWSKVSLWMTVASYLRILKQRVIDLSVLFTT